jgi:DNA-binding NarL/FixJ family response regulator
MESACTNHFDAAILDSHLDHTNGIDLIEKIYKTCSAMPLIYISDWPDPLIFDKALAKGASAAISKAQLSGESLVQVISDVIMKNPARLSGTLN